MRAICHLFFATHWVTNRYRVSAMQQIILTTNDENQCKRLTGEMPMSRHNTGFHKRLGFYVQNHFTRGRLLSSNKEYQNRAKAVPESDEKTKPWQNHDNFIWFLRLPHTKILGATIVVAPGFFHCLFRKSVYHMFFLREKPGLLPALVVNFRIRCTKL